MSGLEMKFMVLEESVASLPGLLSRGLALMLDLDLKIEAVEEQLAKKKKEYLANQAANKASENEQSQTLFAGETTAVRTRKRKKKGTDIQIEPAEIGHSSSVSEPFDNELNEIRFLQAKQLQFLHEKISLGEQNLHLILASRHAVSNLLHEASGKSVVPSTTSNLGPNNGLPSEVSGTASLRRSTRKSLHSTSAYDAGNPGWNQD